MRYHRVTVRNFRGISDARVEFPEGRLLVIEGPNEAGKSSIVEAIRLLFDFTAASNAEEVRRVRPLGRDADPEVELEFSIGGRRCRYRKVFNRRGVTELEVSGSSEAVYSGREAHDQARRLLEEAVDEALFESLRVLQGESLVTPGGLSKSQRLLAALDAAAGSDPAGEGLFERAKKEFGRYYTEKQERETDELQAARKIMQEAQQQVAELGAEVRALEEKAERVRQLEPEVAKLRERVRELETGQRELGARLEARREAEHAEELARKELEAAEAQLRQVGEEVQRRAERGREAERLARELESLEGELAARRGELAELEGEARAKREAANAAEKQFETASARAKTLADDLNYAQELLQAAQMERRLQAIVEAEERREAAQAFLAGCRVTPELLKRVEEAEQQVQRTEAQLRAVVVQVEVEGPAGAAVVVDGEERPLERGLLKVEVTEERRIDLPGGFAVVVRPSQSQGLLEGRLRERREELERLLAQAGAENAQEARELEQRRLAARQEVEQAERTIHGQLMDLPNREDLEGRLARTRGRIAAYRATHAGRTLPATIEEARRAKETGDAEVEETRAAAEAAERAAREAEGALRGADAAVGEIAKRVERSRGLLERLRAEAEQAERERPSARLDEELAAARGAAAHAQRRLEEVRARLAEIGDPGPELERVASELETGKRRLREAEREMDEARGALRHAGDGTLQAQLDEARSRLEAATERAERVERKAEAARLLLRTLEKHREAAQRMYGPLLAERMAELGRRVFGEDFAVELDAELAPKRRRLNGTWLDVKDLSVGAREQLAVLHRAACAAAAARDGVPFFLDDALGWSDEQRLEEIARVLAELASEVQVVVLTCQPGRFAAAQPAEVVQIAGGRTGATDGTREGTQPGLL
ncbi:AAA family ATPase [Tepidiforma thermophila]|uniref:DNA repair exonuclease SbcCD ATPase subunit n=1 Tax=Tepidiforma thermophila (strain KCTC 52669 / CGMCC 1.13589 / G233) TaxID=2761530 RepID=A0A2A9HIR5_TEPT2|nr:AAA family ATPase [Tepidiforma thermophila]PFG75293.1 DNA repair exonuclease SbcCD ATPase subunit [Tepidiforma thermophila]